MGKWLALNGFDGVAGEGEGVVVANLVGAALMEQSFTTIEDKKSAQCQRATLDISARDLHVRWGEMCSALRYLHVSGLMFFMAFGNIGHGQTGAQFTLPWKAPLLAI